jgi:outer membrane protein OmpA-like peptidoglycan-associated protein
MIRLAVAIVIVLLMLLGGAVWLWHGSLNLPEIAGAPPAEAPASAPDSKAPAAKAKQGPADASQGSFDVARIDPSGTSVFAGRAEPGASVTIMADGEPVGTTQADANGEWTFATEHKFASADPELGLKTAPPAEARREPGARTELADRSGEQGRQKTGEPQAAGSVTSQLLKNFEGMVEAARTAAKEEEVAPKAPSALPASDAAPTSVAAVRLPPPGEPAARKSVPVPITFVYNEANFTGDGRKAAGLLLEYLKLKHFAEVTLTGHADERGSNEFNMELSRERLETVAKFLKDGGFAGELKLIPKGESEPFTGVVRSQYGPEEIFQLDRRVELVITP